MVQEVFQEIHQTEWFYPFSVFDNITSADN